MTLNFLASSSSFLPAIVATFLKSKFEKVSRSINIFAAFLNYDCFLFLMSLCKSFPGQNTWKSLWKKTDLHQRCLAARENDRVLINHEFWLMKDQYSMLNCTSFFKSALLFTHWLSCTTIFFANSYFDKLYGNFFTLQLFCGTVLLLNIHRAVRMLLTHVHKLHISSTILPFPKLLCFHENVEKSLLCTPQPLAEESSMDEMRNTKRDIWKCLWGGKVRTFVPEKKRQQEASHLEPHLFLPLLGITLYHAAWLAGKAWD